MPDQRTICPSCGGSGHVAGHDGGSWCQACGGSGHVALRGAGRPGPTATPSGGGLGGLASLLFLVALVGVPVVALVVVLDWFVVLAGPMRAVVEALPGDLGIVTVAGGEGNPLVLTVLVAVAALALLVVVGLRHRRAVRATERMRDVWLARAWGLLLAVVVVAALPLVVTTWAVGSGLDLERPDTVPTMTQPWQVALVGVVLLLFAWLWTGRRYVVADRRAERAAARAAAAAAEQSR